MYIICFFDEAAKSNVWGCISGEDAMQVFDTADEVK